MKAEPPTLYEFVRSTLAARGGIISRGELLAVIQADPQAAERLERSQGYSRVLGNMKYSGFIELEGDLVRRTSRKVGRRRL